MYLRVQGNFINGDFSTKILRHYQEDDDAHTWKIEGLNVRVEHKRVSFAVTVFCAKYRTKVYVPYIFK